MRKSAQVHIFRQAVALSMPTGETTYLHKRDARALAKLLNSAARDPDGFRSATIELQKPHND